MKNAWGLAILLSVASAPGAAQTTAELINDARTPENVLLHSMGYDRKSYSPLDSNQHVQRSPASPHLEHQPDE